MKFKTEERLQYLFFKEKGEYINLISKLCRDIWYMTYSLFLMRKKNDVFGL